MLRKRSHQAFTDLEAEQPLSPVLQPPQQRMGSEDSDGDAVMGTGGRPQRIWHGQLCAAGIQLAFHICIRSGIVWIGPCHTSESKGATHEWLDPRYCARTTHQA